LKARAWQGLKGILWSGLPLIVSCFHEYADKKNKQEFENTDSCICMQYRAHSSKVLHAHYFLAKTH